MGTNALAGTDTKTIVRLAQQALNATTRPATPPLWDGQAAARIVAVLHGWDKE